MSTSGDIMSTSGDIMSTSGDVRYIVGCSVHRGHIMSTSGECHEYIEGYHEYIGGYHEYIGGYRDACGGYNEYIGGCLLHRGFQYKSKAFISLLPHMNHNIPPRYSISP